MLLKKYLQKFTKEQLIEQILELNKKYKDVKSYYEFSINPDVDLKTEIVKGTIYQCFFPERGSKLRLKEARKAISEFKKLAPTPDALAEVMIYYVENGVDFTNTYGDIDEPFYNSVEGMYDDALKYMSKNGLLSKFKDRAEKIVDDTKNIGWGFHDSLCDSFYTYYIN